jgi:hypothetical protein
MRRYRWPTTGYRVGLKEGRLVPTDPPSTSVPKALLASLLALCGLVLCGCGAEEVRPDLQPARGTLTINGRPALGAMLVLHPAGAEPFDSRGTRPRATVAGDGSFELTTYQTGDGAPVGDYDVAVLWFVDPNADAPRDKLGGRLADPKKSGIRLSVKSGVSELEPIEINGIEVAVRPPTKPTRDYDQVD